MCVSKGQISVDCKKKRVFLTIIWIIGLMFTCNNLIENYKLYKTYPTLQMAKSDADSKSLIGIIYFIYIISNYISKTSNMFHLTTFTTENQPTLSKSDNQLTTKALRPC